MARPDNALEYAPTGEPYLGSRLRQLRRLKGWSITDLSKEVGRSAAALSKIETNHARLSGTLLGVLARTLGADEDALEAVPLHPRLDVPVKQYEPSNSTGEENDRDEEIHRLKAEVGGLKAEVAELAAAVAGFTDLAGVILDALGDSPLIEVIPGSSVGASQRDPWGGLASSLMVPFGEGLEREEAYEEDGSRIYPSDVEFQNSP